MSQKRPDFDYRYSIIPGGAVTDDRISMRDLQVLALLGRHTDKKGWCWRSQVEMARELRCGRATISRSIKRLAETGWIEQRAMPRGRAVLKEGQQPFSAFMYRVKIDRDDEEEVVPQADVPINGHPPVGGSKNGHGVPIAGGQGVPIQAGTHRRTPIKDQPNSLAPASAGESEKLASLGQGSSERFPEFRSIVNKTWPRGFPPDNEVAARKAWDLVTCSHPADLVIACAGLHGADKTLAQQQRAKDGGTQHMRLPANWLRDGDWEGYIPRAEQAAADDARAATALGEVRRALGDGVFGMLRREGMPDNAVARLAGMTLTPPAAFTVTSAFQKTLLDRYTGALERHLGERPAFTLVQLVRRAS